MGVLVTFTVEDRLCALRLSIVERVVRAVEVTPIPHAPSVVLGVISVEGNVIPVVSLRPRLRLAEREIAPSDQFLIARSRRSDSARDRIVGLVVDSTTGVIELPEQSIVACDSILPGLEHLHGVATLPEGLILIHDLDAFLSLKEERALDRSLAGEAP